MKNIIAVTIGSIDGIGIKLLYKEWQNKKINNFVIITNYNILKKHLKKIVNLNQINKIKELDFSQYNKEKLNILEIYANNKYENAYFSLKKAYELTKKNKFIGILTLPLNKREIKLNCSKLFIDQTTYFSKLENIKNSNMIFMYKNKFFIPLTTHIELKNVINFFKKNKKNIYEKIKNINLSLKNDFNIKKPKILISGINPHSGENGLISKDDHNFLKPIIKKLNSNKIKIVGPISGDSMIDTYNLQKYDVFIFAYHDQALIPFKMISKFKGINFTSNLDIIRVSPSHGTANNFNLKLATSLGIRNSIKAIRTINENRNKYKI